MTTKLKPGTLLYYLILFKKPPERILVMFIKSARIEDSKREYFTHTFLTEEGEILLTSSEKENPLNDIFCRHYFKIIENLGSENKNEIKNRKIIQTFRQTQ